MAKEKRKSAREENQFWCFRENKQSVCLRKKQSNFLRNKKVLEDNEKASIGRRFEKAIAICRVKYLFLSYFGFSL